MRDLATTRHRLEGKIAELIDLLDLLDGDPDLEETGDDEPSIGGTAVFDRNGVLQHDLEQDEDSEDSLGWSNPEGLRIDVPEEAAQFMGLQIDWDS